MIFIPSKEKYSSISPRLKEVLDIVYAKRPLVEYEVIDVNSSMEAEKVAAWQHGQRLGSIDSNYRRYSPTNNANEIWFSVESPNIKKQRGRNHTKFTKEAKSAARIAIESFIKKTLAPMGRELIESATSEVERMGSHVRHNFNKSLSVSAQTIFSYFVETKLGLAPKVPKVIESQITEEVIRRYENMVIAEGVCEHLTRKNGFFVGVMRDDTLLVTDVADPTTASKHSSTYELVDYMQEKITMLKLLEKNQFAENIGIRVSIYGEEQDIYFIVKGETVVM